MLGKTSISAIRALLVLTEQDPAFCLSPRRIAEELNESPTYLAKVVRHMVKVGILEAEKGVKGGVRLLQRPEDVTLLAIVEACQGTIAGDYCKSSRPRSSFCNFHRAALELHEAITGVLGRWTLADLVARPEATGQLSGGVTCLMLGGFNAQPARIRRLEAGG
jgi:Rrf2 family protein